VQRLRERRPAAAQVPEPLKPDQGESRRGRSQVMRVAGLLDQDGPKHTQGCKQRRDECARVRNSLGDRTTGSVSAGPKKKAHSGTRLAMFPYALPIGDRRKRAGPVPRRNSAAVLHGVGRSGGGLLPGQVNGQP